MSLEVTLEVGHAAVTLNVVALGMRALPATGRAKKRADADGRSSLFVARFGASEESILGRRCSGAEIRVAKSMSVGRSGGRLGARGLGVVCILESSAFPGARSRRRDILVLTTVDFALALRIYVRVAIEDNGNVFVGFLAACTRTRGDVLSDWNLDVRVQWYGESRMRSLKRRRLRRRQVWRVIQDMR